MADVSSSSDPTMTFENYIDESIDPGNSLLIATVLFCILSIAILPCMVYVGMKFRHHESIESEEEEENTSETINGVPGGTNTSRIAEQLRNRKSDRHNSDDDDDDDDDQSSTSRRRRQNQLLNVYAADTKTKRKEQKKKGDNDDDSSSDGKGNDVEDDDVSAQTSTASVASVLMNALLITSPHGGVVKRRNQMHTARREAQLNNDNDDNNESSCLENVDSRSFNNHSILGPLDHDAVSIRDAIDGGTVRNAGRNEITGHDNDDSTSGILHYMCGSWFYQLLLVADYDYETKRLLKLGAPFIMQAILIGVMETTRVALIGKFIGTSALSAYVIVQLAVGTTDLFLLGLIEACASLCSHAVGIGNKRLAGQYIQIATILFTVFYIPIFIFWIYMIGPLFVWLGFDGSEDGPTRVIGEQFTMLYLFARFIMGVHNSSHALLDVIGQEKYSTAYVSLQEVALTIVYLIAALQPGASDLNLVGILHIAVAAAALIINSAIIAYYGWFDKFLDGLVGSFALLNVQATKILLGTSTSLALGSLLAYGEWEILIVFASTLGPAEVATWGLLGTLWDALELVTEAVADAGEVRTALLLGAGKPEEAKLSSYKSLYLGTLASILITACMFIVGDNIPSWLTNDPTLQRMIAELIPLFGIGNIALSIGTLSWTLVGAQGRFRLSTAVGLSGGWFVALPMAAVLSLVYNVNLQGQTAAVVIGYMVSGTINSYILFQSDWPKLSRRVIARNDGMSMGSDEGDDSSSSSSSSSSDDE